MDDTTEHQNKADVAANLSGRSLSKELVRSNSSNRDLGSQQNSPTTPTFRQRNEGVENALSRSRENKKPEKSLISNFPLFANSVDSVPDGVHQEPSLEKSSGDSDAYGVIQLPNFMGSPTIKKATSLPLPLKKKKSFKKKEKKANVVKKV